MYHNIVVRLVWRMEAEGSWHNGVLGRFVVVLLVFNLFEVSVVSTHKY